MNGKSKCKILKEIRRQIAAENDIAYATAECRHQGDCPGTCPKCEAEVRYLEEQLRLRQAAGKAVAVAGIAAALLVTTPGCALADVLNPATGGAPLPPSGYGEQVKGELEYPTDIQGGVPFETDPTELLMGEPMPPEEWGDLLASDPPLMGELPPGE